MSFMRMLEPGSFKLHYMLLKKTIMCKRDQLKDLKEKRPIRILLNSTLNIEVVYVILEGIVQFSKMNFSDE